MRTTEKVKGRERESVRDGEKKEGRKEREREYDPPRRVYVCVVVVACEAERVGSTLPKLCARTTP